MVVTLQMDPNKITISFPDEPLDNGIPEELLVYGLLSVYSRKCDLLQSALQLSRVSELTSIYDAFLTFDSQHRKQLRRSVCKHSIEAAISMLQALMYYLQSSCTKRVQLSPVAECVLRETVTLHSLFWEKLMAGKGIMFDEFIDAPMELLNELGTENSFLLVK